MTAITKPKQPLSKKSLPPPLALPNTGLYDRFLERLSSSLHRLLYTLHSHGARVYQKKSKETGSTPLRVTLFAFFPVARAMYVRIRGSTSNYIFPSPLPPPPSGEKDFLFPTYPLSFGESCTVSAWDRPSEEDIWQKKREFGGVYSSLQYSAHSISWWWCVQRPPPPPPPG